MALADIQKQTAENEAYYNSRLARSMGKTNGGGRSDLKSIKGLEDQPSFDDWAKLGIGFTNRGLLFDPSVTQDTFVALGSFCGLINNASKLWVGDWAAYGQLRWDYNRQELADMAGLDPETIDNYLSIGRKVPTMNRVAGLTTRHYAAVSSLDRGTQKAILKIAGRNKWTSDMVRYKVQAVRDFGQPINDTPIFRSDLDALKEAAAAGNGNGHVTTVTRTVKHSDEYKLALLRDTDDLPALFEVEVKANTEIEIALVGDLDHLLALLSANLPDEMVIGIKVIEVTANDQEA